MTSTKSKVLRLVIGAVRVLSRRNRVACVDGGSVAGLGSKAVGGIVKVICAASVRGRAHASVRARFVRCIVFDIDSGLGELGEKVNPVC